MSKSKDLTFDLANHKHRMARLTGSSAFVGGYCMNPKGANSITCTRYRRKAITSWSVTSKEGRHQSAYKGCQRRNRD